MKPKQGQRGREGVGSAPQRAQCARRAPLKPEIMWSDLCSRLPCWETTGSAESTQQGWVRFKRGWTDSGWGGLQGDLGNI